MLLKVLLVSSLFYSLAVGEGGPLYRRRAYHSLAVLGEYLFIDGGEISEYIDGVKPTGSSDSEAVKNTTLIPLNSKWATKDVHNLYKYAEYPTEIQPAKDLLLWTNPDKDELYRWAGIPATGYSIEDKSDKTLGVLSSAGKEGMKWGAIAANEKAQPPGKDGAPVTCGGLGLYFGGIMSDKTVKDGEYNIFDGVLSYNMTDSSWERNRNGTMDLKYRRNEMGEAICIDGLLESPLALVLGGSWKDKNGNPQWYNLTEVTLYDPIGRKWYNQATIGSQPGVRNDFCAVGASGRNGTYEIFVFGGAGEFSGVEKVCILTLPGFYWYCPQGIETEIRTRHSCARIGNRQMVSVGGLDGWRVTNTTWASPDTWPNTLGIFDLTELKWKETYDPEATSYESPRIIQEWYAKQNREQVAWTNTELETIFTKSLTNDDNRTTTTNTIENTSDAHKPANIAPIVGGVVGGVAFVSLLVAALWFLRWRRKQEDNISPSDNDQHAAEFSPQYGGYPKDNTLQLPSGEHNGYSSARGELDGTTRSELGSEINRSPQPFEYYKPQAELGAPDLIELDGVAYPRILTTSDHP